ncbi:alpha/beta hydrolase-fold protein [Adhaeribacter aquaticus]|uniref:alpha/beta hydrolase-fold protein n=1 Tax=Adhaeribacter aquaticus TaxID=299567 RepID=UPI0008FEE64C|nr:alpha/beta hydrolase-fold protein [Adhaeribacter aquaticus]
MKYFFNFLILFFTVFGATAQSQMKFSLGFADSVKSSVLNEQRHLLVYTPYAGKQTRATSTQTYPVLYVLDGESNFRSVAVTVERLAQLGLCPPMIVVGIANTDRSRDLTPTAVANNTSGVHNSGGGEKFLSFIERELIPHIDSNHPTAPYKLLWGHSLGGLMVMQTMAHNKDMFNGYIAIDAAIWWDKHRVLDESKSALGKGGYEGKTLFLAMANRMEKGVDTTAVQSDTTEQTELIRYNLDLVRHIRRHPGNKLRFRHAYYENESHNTVPFIASYDALRFLFDYYAFPTGDSQINHPDLPSLIAEHYRRVSKELGYQILPGANLVNNLGYYSLGQKKYDVARQLFNMNVLNYPKDANLQDSFGDYYKAVGDKKNAIAWYKKALAVMEIPETRAKLNELTKKK